MAILPQYRLPKDMATYVWNLLTIMPGHYGDKKGGKGAAKKGAKAKMSPQMMKRMEMMKKKGGKK